MLSFSYITKLLIQLKNIYLIKNTITRITNHSYLGLHHPIQQNNLSILKQQIYNSGSLFIKFAQWYISKLKSNDIKENDSTTTQIITYFEDIFEQCPYHNLEFTKSSFHKELNISLDDYIIPNTLKPLASGSIGQVYFAIRKEDNKEIAIKVKHPDIDNDLENQTELIHFFKWIQNIKYFKKKYNLFFNIDDFLNDINLQCDFNNEANNCKKFRENFSDSKNQIIFPEVLFQSRNILISEYIEGKDFEEFTDFQRYNICLNFLCFFNQMMLIDNFIHGDLHCKNWKVRINPDTNQPQIIIYDCGICFSNKDIKITQDFWFAVSRYDVDLLHKAILKFIIKSDNKDVNTTATKTSDGDADDIMSINGVTEQELHDEIKKTLLEFGEKCLGTSIVLKTILNFFSMHNIMVDKFLLNFSILLCVLEDFLVKNNVINNDTNINMFNVINQMELDLISFAETKKCYSKVNQLFKNENETKFKKYQNNIEKYNVTHLDKDKKLFSNLEFSSIKFKPID